MWFNMNVITFVGPGNLWSNPHSIRARGSCRGGYVPRTNGGKAEVSRGIAEDDSVLGNPGLQREEQRLDEGRPQKAH